MTSSLLEKLPSGERVLVDSTVFIYHFVGQSESCTRFLSRCESGDVKAYTSVVVAAEVAHRLMMIEAVAAGLVRPGGVLRRLREKPDVVRKLRLYQEQVERIPLMGVEVLPLDVRTWLESERFRRRFGLLMNDSLVAATADCRGIACLASADRDFDRVKPLRRYRPGDLAASLEA